jgi:hypothetical protein
MFLLLLLTIFMTMFMTMMMVEGKKEDEEKIIHIFFPLCAAVESKQANEAKKAEIESIFAPKSTLFVSFLW